jgi:transcriptional regulator with XRE-family HTH domain
MRIPPSRSRAFLRFSKGLASRVRHLRTERGWSARELARRIGVGVATVRRIERALGNPSLAVLVSAAKAMKVPLSQLLGKKADEG